MDAASEFTKLILIFLYINFVKPSQSLSLNTVIQNILRITDQIVAFVYFFFIISFISAIIYT